MSFLKSGKFCVCLNPLWNAKDSFNQENIHRLKIWSNLEMLLESRMLCLGLGKLNLSKYHDRGCSIMLGPKRKMCSFFQRLISA